VANEQAVEQRRLRWLGWVLAAVVLGGVVLLLWNRGKDLIAGQSLGATSYLLIALLVFGDAVFPVLPGETTLSAGAVLASAGKLQLWLVFLAGAIGAVAGDSAVYWIARRAKGKVREWMNRGADNKTAAKVLDQVRQHGPLVLLFGRYVPGVRFVLNASLGAVIRMPYPRFVFWSTISGTLWSAFNCLGAYYIGTLLSGYPVMSLAATFLLTAGLITSVIWIENQAHRHRAKRSGTSQPG
jgi:membrane protein DedA with SNARE-associated domain